MTVEERKQISDLTKQISSLEGAVTNELENVQKRLDSHSTDIRALNGLVNKIDIYIAEQQTLRNQQDKEEQVQRIELKDLRVQKRGKSYDLLLISIGGLFTFLWGISLYLVKIYILCPTK